ncbi:MAG: tyrosine-type recombinase/integrase, partial [Desulfurococcales archaeon]|nr:tyrosine-type recombinase/integrase [Desulfurococcales archaeon]
MRFELPEVSPEDVAELGVWEALEEFLMSLEAAGASEKTVKAYRAGISDFLKFVGKEKVRDLRVGDFTRWKLERMRKGFPKGSKDRRKAQMTLHYYSLYVRSFLKWLGVVKSAPAVSRPRGRSQVSVLTPKEVYALLNAARDVIDVLVVALLFETGLRAQEVLSLTIDDIDLENREIKVRNAKYGEERTVFFGPLTQAVLQRYLRTVSEGNKLIPLSYSGLYKRLKSLARRAGVDPSKVRPHILRHTFATEALRRGLNLVALQTLLGHKDIK